MIRGMGAPPMQLAAAVRGDDEPAVPAASVLPTMTLLDAARESSKRGCAIELDGEPS